MKHMSILTVILCVSAVPLAWTQAPTPAAQPTPRSGESLPSSTLKIHEEPLGELSPGSKVELARCTDNHLAWIEKAGGKRVVKLDGKPVGTYDDANSLRFSADEQHLAFAAKRNGEWVVVLDGQERTKEYGRLSAPALSANGKFFAAAGCREKKCHVIVNGDETSPEFEDINGLGFTESGAHYAYFAKRHKKWVLMLDGKEYGPEMNDFVDWVTDPEAKRVAVAGLIGEKWTWVVDGIRGPALDVISPIVFSPDYQHYAYGGTDAKWGFAKHKTHGVMVVDGKVAGEYEGRGFGGAWVGMFGYSNQIATGMRSLEPGFHGVSDPQYTPEGKLVYAGRRGDNEVVVLTDGTPGPAFEDIVSSIAVSKDGKHIAYIGKRGDSFVEVRDQQPGASFLGKGVESFVGALEMSDDGDRLAYEIVRGGRMYKARYTIRALRRVVIDGQGGPEYDALGIRDIGLRRQGKGYHYTVIGAEGSRDRVVFNGLETKLYDSVFGGSLEFIDDRTLEFVAQDGQRFVKVTAVLE
jgi:hypothetical protein